jgi:beta-lactamase superfamily II metal-dependent hydrolase
MLSAALVLSLTALYLAGGNRILSKLIAPSSQPQSYDLRVTMLDVGQGDSILLSSGGQYMLIDAGENDQGDTVVSDLKSYGVDKLAAVVGTHPHSDHIGGLDTVIKAFPVDALYMPRKTANTQTYEDVLDAAAARKLKITVPLPGDKLKLGEAEITFLWPPGGFDSTNENDCSIVIMVKADGFKILLCGDIEKDAENGILSMGEAVGCDVLKVAHHGSDTSSTKDFLKQAMPKVALISVGLHNDYNHPDKSVLKRLSNIGAEVHRTDLNGTITVTIVDGKLAVQDSKKNK